MIGISQWHSEIEKLMTENRQAYKRTQEKEHKMAALPAARKNAKNQ